MSPRKSVPPMIDENPPSVCCRDCHYLEPTNIEHGSCYGVPPIVIIDNEGDLMCPRPIVMLDDRACHFWKPRHSA